MDKPECSICDNIFDSNDHRPRQLPCGHGFCSLCIETSIHRGDKACAICRKEHRASSSTDLPISFLLEDFAHKLAVSASQKHISESIHEGNYGMCPKHKEIPLYFKCISHGFNVCHSCVVIDHPPTSCKLISFEDEIKETKYSQIEALKKQTQAIMTMESDIYILHQENMGNIDLLVSRREQINQEIFEKRNYQEELRITIKKCQDEQKSLIIMENKITAATSYEDIVSQCEKGKIDVLQCQKWEEQRKRELNINQVYGQVENSGILRSCKVLKENGSLFIPCLSRNVIPPSSAKLIKEDELGLNSFTTTVYMDISERGCILGRLLIRIFSNTYFGLRFIEMVLGMDGLSMKGTNFFKGTNCYVQLNDYMTEDGTKESMNFDFEVKYNEKQNKPSRGMIHFHSSTFLLWNKDIGGRFKFPFHIGNIYSGMNVIDTIASKNKGVTDISISNCGIVLKS